jgi:hypothetical protein
MEGRGAMSKDLPVKASFSSAGNALLPVPAHLQGVPGTQRAVSSANALGVDSDHEAIVVWLNTRAKNAHTRKAYLQELRRFMAFMLYLRGRPVSSATLGDLEAFRVWLAVPYLPAEGWPADFMPFKLDCAAGDGHACAGSPSAAVAGPTRRSAASSAFYTRAATWPPTPA